jgi:2-polyprenyl-6-methoxyphenol hydroxylase-like FAD-dependent oxidoreductase
MARPETEVVVVGGGPAGIMVGLLLARAGVQTVVMEKHADFFRDFRGDTVHPSTMEILDQLGMLERFLERPHTRIDSAELRWNGRDLRVGDLSHLSTPAPFIAMMPQWHFLDFLRDEAAVYPAFSLRMEAEVASLIEHEGRVAGVRLTTGDEIATRLTIMADGRASLVRSQRLLPVEDLGAPIDVFWFAVPKSGQGTALRGMIEGSHMMVLIDRGTYWQCAFILPKGGAEAVRSGGIAAFRETVRRLAPDLPDLETALPDWDPIKLLSVSLDRLSQWHRPGLLAIGDAAHAMSPVGGIGINLAIQDAVCAANLLAAPLREDLPVDGLLERVQRRRMLPTRVVQSAQRAAHERLLLPVLAGQADTRPPWPLRLLNRFPVLRRIPGRAIGLGFRRERVSSPVG